MRSLIVSALVLGSILACTGETHHVQRRVASSHSVTGGERLVPRCDDRRCSESYAFHDTTYPYLWWYYIYTYPVGYPVYITPSTPTLPSSGTWSASKTAPPLEEVVDDTEEVPVVYTVPSNQVQDALVGVDLTASEESELEPMTEVEPTPGIPPETMPETEPAPAPSSASEPSSEEGGDAGGFGEAGGFDAGGGGE